MSKLNQIEKKTNEKVNFTITLPAFDELKALKKFYHLNFCFHFFFFQFYKQNKYPILAILCKIKCSDNKIFA